VPVYEYKCVARDHVFEQRRMMAEADEPAPCPAGHTDVRRLLSVFAAGGRADAGGSTIAAAPMRGCGGGCACH